MAKGKWPNVQFGDLIDDPPLLNEMYRDYLSGDLTEKEMPDFVNALVEQGFLLPIDPCTTGCVINSRVSGDHAYCGCHCHADTLPATPPSRERESIYDAADRRKGER